MRLPNDLILAKTTPQIDIILGGHDHMYESSVDKKTGVFVVKSGTELAVFSDI
jgi:5'-nucleotidase